MCGIPQTMGGAEVGGCLGDPFNQTMLHVCMSINRTETRKLDIGILRNSATRRSTAESQDTRTRGTPSEDAEDIAEGWVRGRVQRACRLCGWSPPM